MRYLLSTFLVFCFCSVNAQSSDTVSTKLDETWRLKTAKKYWKFSPFDVISILPTFGTDVEVQLNERRSFQVGIGVIPKFTKGFLNQFSGFDGMFGYRLRGESRFKVPDKGNRYLAIGLSFRHLIVKDEIFVGMDPFMNDWGTTNYVYFQRFDVSANRFNINIDLKYGFQKIKTAGYVLDFYAGLSVRSLVIRGKSDIPDGGHSFNVQRGMWTIAENYNLIYPTPIAGVKIGFSN
jgi:hypothetical protein